MRTIIAGSRTFCFLHNYEIMCREIAKLPFTITEVVSGGAVGADLLGEHWAKNHNIPVSQFKPDWGAGRQGGILRNIKMAKHADALVAFWDGKSKGTQHMISEAKSKNLKVTVIMTDDTPQPQGMTRWVNDNKEYIDSAMPIRHYDKQLPPGNCGWFYVYHDRNTIPRVGMRYWDGQTWWAHDSSSNTGLSPNNSFDYWIFVVGVSDRQTDQ